MDVSCPSCQSEYELEDARVPTEGATVKCAQCSHVFRVKRPANGAQVGQVSELPPAPPSREWKVRQGNGNVFSCRELTTLQKWIIEGKVGRDDEISLSGDTWKRLGNIPELASFFQVYEEATRARSYEALKAVGPAPTTTTTPTPRPPPRDAPTEPALLPVPSSKGVRETLRGAQFSMPVPEAEPGAQPPPPPPPSLPPIPPPLPATIARPPTPSPAPAPAPVPVAAAVKQPSTPRPLKVPPKPSFEPSDADLQRAVRGSSGRGMWALAFIGIAVGAGLGWYFGWYAPEQTRLAEEKVAEAQQAEVQARALVEARKRADEARAAADRLQAALETDAGGGADAGLIAAVFDAGATLVDTGAAAVDAGAPALRDAGLFDAGAAAVGVDAGSPDAGAVKAPTPLRTWDWYLSQGDHLRNLDRAEQALDMYGRAVELRPESAEALAGRGLALLDLGRALAAQNSLEQAVRLAPRYGPALMGLAEANRTLGRKAAALENYQKYLDVLPNGPEAAVARTQVEKLKAETP